MGKGVYFYPHEYLRDRQLDVILNWKKDEVENPEIACNRKGAQVSKESAFESKKKLNWKKILPLINLKLRPPNASKDAVIFLWGGLIINARFIVELDNPYSLTGYNVSALHFWKFFIKQILLSKRCIKIRCISNACRSSLISIFGKQIINKIEVVYPSIGLKLRAADKTVSASCCFIFVSSQFDIKGGRELLSAFIKLNEKLPNTRLKLVTYLPENIEINLKGHRGITVISPDMTREELSDKHLKLADVLVHPTYIESFGLVVLEAIAAGLPIIATDVYAIREMVADKSNGFLLSAPISNWSGIHPSKHFINIRNIKKDIAKTEMSIFEQVLFESMYSLAVSPSKRMLMSNNSANLFAKKFLRLDGGSLEEYCSKK